jgi:hypothetical protein
MALFRFRQGNFVSLDTDDNEEAEPESGTVEYY